MKNKILIAGCLLILLVFNTMVFNKEQHIVNGGTVILKLAPRDPRSLMQGDYMVLRYELAQKAASEFQEHEGRLFLDLDPRGIAQRLHREPKPGRVCLQFRRHEGQILFGIESFFFQEGQRDKYDRAKYGELKVSPDGIPVLVRLLDKDLAPL